MPDSKPVLVDATWLPAYDVQLPDGTVVTQGSTHKIPAGEAAESDHWAPVAPVKPAAPEASAKPTAPASPDAPKEN